MARTITSANAIFMLGVDSVFPNPIQLQGFSADDIFSTETIDSAETIMGVDGKLSAGFVFVAVKQSVQLQADSASNDLFDQWYAAQQQAKELFAAQGQVVLTSLGLTWTMTKGYLTSFPPMPDGGKTLKPRKYGITWERISPASA